MQNVNSETMRLNYVPSKKEWRMAKGMGTAQGPGHYPSLKVDEDHSGKFTFVIQNPDNVTFATRDPFVPKKGKTNPGDFKHQFVPSPGGSKTLVVEVRNTNANGGEYEGGTYEYELRFSNNTTLDPIVTNMGCCRIRQSDPDPSPTPYYAAGAVAVIAVTAAVAYKLLRR